MKFTKGRIILIIMAVTMLASCGTRHEEDCGPVYIEDTYTADGIAPQEDLRMTLPKALRKITEENRANVFPAPYEGLGEALEGFKTPNLDADIDAAIAGRIRQYREQGASSPAELAREDIIYEINFLFDLLRYGYGAYQYFGGDNVFLPLRDSMLEQLAQMANPLGIDAYLNDLLLPSLRSVIADNHFWLEDRQIGVGSQLFMNEGFVIRQIESDFIVEIDGAAYKVLTDAILPTLTRDGEFVWAFGYVEYGLLPNFSRWGFQKDVQLENVETGISHIRTVNLYSVPNAENLAGSMFTVRERDCIAILENRRLWERDRDPSLQEFVNTAATLRDEPVLILDLRGHSGGNDGIAHQWVQQYTGHAPSYDMMFRHIRLNSLTVNELNTWMEAVSPPQWQLWDSGDEHRFIPNENLVIVLIDNAIGSAGDTFVGYLRQLENVLLVGANTRGMLVTGNVGSAVLPFSRFDIRFGVSLNIRTNLSQFEGVGFAPDLWVPPGESLERVLNFIQNTKEIP